MRHILWRATGLVVLILAALGSFNLAVWFIDRDPPIRYEDARALAETVEPGGTIEVQFSVFRWRICPVAAKRWLYDAAEEKHSIPQFTTGPALLAGRETYRRTITVPTSAAIGPARYEVTLEYTCNPLQRVMGPIRIVSPAVWFEIVPGRKATANSSAGSDG